MLVTAQVRGLPRVSREGNAPYPRCGESDYLLAPRSNSSFPDQTGPRRRGGETRPNRTAGTFECRYVNAHESGYSRSGPELPAELDRLLGAVARGEHGAFDLVYEQLHEPIRRQVRAVLGDLAQSEEVTQEVLLELWRTAFRYDEAKGSAVAWAMTIARRRAIDRVRRTVASVAREHQTVAPASPWDQPGEAAADALDRERLLGCLNQLSDLQREAITLAFYGGHTYSQVASILDVPLGTVKARIRDGVIKLRGCMLSEQQIPARKSVGGRPGGSG